MTSDDSSCDQEDSSFGFDGVESNDIVESRRWMEPCSKYIPLNTYNSSGCTEHEAEETSLDNESMHNIIIKNNYVMGIEMVTINTWEIQYISHDKPLRNV